MKTERQLLRQIQQVEAVNTIEAEFDLALCQRDHALLETYYPAVFGAVCQMVAAGVELDTIEKRARRIVGAEPILLQRVVNCARYEAGLQVRK